MNSAASGWDPLPRAELRSLLGTNGEPWWWLAGGHAIELFVGHALRAHADVDVLVLRRDQRRLYDALRDWELAYVSGPGHLEPWMDGTELDAGVHDIWCRHAPGGRWRLQVMIDESTGSMWHSRRNGAVHRPVSDIGRTTVDGLPYLAPEIQLFYKLTATDGMRAKDELDLRAALPLLDDSARAWLEDAVSSTLGYEWRA